MWIQTSTTRTPYDVLHSYNILDFQLRASIPHSLGHKYSQKKRKRTRMREYPEDRAGMTYTPKTDRKHEVRNLEYSVYVGASKEARRRPIPGSGKGALPRIPRVCQRTLHSVSPYDRPQQTLRATPANSAL